MPYREADPHRSGELAGEELEAISAEICRLDSLIGDWSALLPDGTDAPPEAVALIVERERLEEVLRARAGVASTAASRDHGPATHRRIWTWIKPWWSR